MSRPSAVPPLSQHPIESAPSLGALLAAMLAVQTFGTSAVLVLAAISPKVAAEFGVEATLVGYQISIVGGAMMASAILLGNLSRVWGPCRALQAGVAVMSAGCLLALVPNLLAMLLASILLGIGYGQVTPASSQLLMRIAPADRRNLVFSVKQTGVPLGGVVAASAAPVIALAWGWRWAYVALALLLAALVLVLQRGRRALDADARDPGARLVDNPLAGLAIVWRRTNLRLLSISGCFLLIAQDCLLAFTVVMFVQQIGYGLVAAGLVLTVSQVGGVLGRLFWGWVADRTGDPMAALAVLALLVAGASATVFPLDRNWPLALVYALFFVLGLGATGWNGAFLAEVARLSPAHAVSQATGASIVIVNLGKFSGPPLFALVYSLTGNFAWTFGLLALPALAAFGCLVAARRSAPEAPGVEHGTPGCKRPGDVGPRPM